MATFQPLVRGGPVTARRQPNILVPIGVPPYSVDGNTTLLGGFSNGSLWPVYANTWAASSQGGITYGIIEAPGPVSKGKNIFAPANSALAGVTGATPFFGRFADFCMTRGNGPSVSLGTKTLILPGLTLDFPASTFVSLNTLDPDTINILTNNPFIANPFTMVDDEYIPGFPNIYFAINHIDIEGQQKFYAVSRVPYNFSLKKFPQPGANPREWDWFTTYDDSTIPRSGSSYQIRGCIPDFVNFKNHILMLNNLLGSNMQAIRTTMFADHSVASVDPVNCDDATIATLLSGQAAQSTVFGFLFQVNGGAPLFPGENKGHILFSPDMTQYAVLNLQGIDHQSALDISNGPVSGVNAHIDPTGVFYFFATQTRIDTGFVIDIPWSAINFKIDPRQPAFSIPGLCGCNPLATLGVASRPVISTEG